MFCPSCGLENAQSQKFCRRCGTNLLALHTASGIVNEMVQGQPTNHIDPKFVLKIITLLGSLGFFLVTAGAVVMSIIQLTSGSELRNEPPFGILLALFGYSALVLICGMLMRWVRLMNNNKPTFPVLSHPINYAPPVPQITPVSAVTPNTNPALNAAPAYQSIIEDETRQFVKQPQNR